VRRGRGQEGATGVERVPCPERGWLGQGLAPRKGWARAMGMAGVGVVMVDLVMLMRRMPSLGAADAQGLRATCPLRGAGRQSRMGWVGGAMADPGLLGDGSGPAEAQTGDRGWSRFGSASPDADSGLIRRNNYEDRPLSTLVIDQTLQRSSAPVRVDRRTAAARPLPPAAGARRGRQWCCCGAGLRITSASNPRFSADAFIDYHPLYPGFLSLEQ
jgi:hypothetical protein